VGRRPLLKSIHLYTAVAWVIAPGRRRRGGATGAAFARPCTRSTRFDQDDRNWLRRRPAPQGRLNAGQKLNAIITAAFAVLFTITGVLLWYGERENALPLRPDDLDSRLADVRVVSGYSSVTST